MSKKIRVVYLRKKIPIKNLSKKWHLKNNILDVFFNKTKENRKKEELIKEDLKEYIKKTNNKLCKKLHENFINKIKIKLFPEINKEEKEKNISILKKHINEYKKKYGGIKKLHSGRDGVAFDLGLNKIIKLQCLRIITELKNFIKEIIICNYINIKLNISPKIEEIIIYSLDSKERNILCMNCESIKYENKYVTGTFIMEKIEHIFYDIFKPSKMEKIYEKKENPLMKKIINIYLLAIKIYIGSLEILLDTNICHNDAHDGNFGFNKQGELKFIDFGMAIILTELSDEQKKKILYEEKIKYCIESEESDNNIIKNYYLLNDLRYFRNMFYLEENLSDLYEEDKISPIKNTIEKLKKGEYKFGTFKEYGKKKIDINNLLKYLENIK